MAMDRCYYMQVFVRRIPPRIFPPPRGARAQEFSPRPWLLRSWTRRYFPTHADPTHLPLPQPAPLNTLTVTQHTQAAAAAGPSTDELLTARFNQDHSCLAVGTRRGYQIFACEPFTSCHASTDGAGIAVLEMLHSSSLVALVSAGERPGDSPRRLRLWNTRSNASICDLNFSTAVLAVRMNKARLLAVLEAKLHIFELSTMKLMHTLETTPNPRGLGELCADAETCHCVVPAAQQGQVLYFDSLQLHALNTVQAHKGPLGCLCLSSAGHLLATASEKGTVIRIHSFPQGALLHTFRRGSLPATICSLSFSPGVLLGGKREQVRRSPDPPLTAPLTAPR